MRWRLLIEREWNQRTKLDHYLAQIAKFIYETRFILGGRSELKLEDFFISFSGTKPEPQELSEEEQEAEQANRLATYKAGMLGMFGLGPNGEQRGPVKKAAPRGVKIPKPAAPPTAAPTPAPESPSSSSPGPPGLTEGKKSKTFAIKPTRKKG